MWKSLLWQQIDIKVIYTLSDKKRCRNIKQNKGLKSDMEQRAADMIAFLTVDVRIFETS